MDMEEIKAAVDEFFKENPNWETTLSKKEWMESEEILTCLVYKTIRRSYSKLNKIRKRKFKTSDISKIMLEAMVEVAEEW